MKVLVGTSKFAKVYHTRPDCCALLGAVTRGSSFEEHSIAAVSSKLAECPFCKKVNSKRTKQDTLPALRPHTRKGEIITKGKPADPSLGGELVYRMTGEDQEVELSVKGSNEQVMRLMLQFNLMITGGVK